MVLLLLITIGASYAYFSAALIGGEETSTITATGGKMEITYAGGNEIIVNDIFPRNEAVTTKTLQ